MVVVVVAQRQQVRQRRVRREIGASGLNELIDFIVAPSHTIILRGPRHIFVKSHGDLRGLQGKDR